MSAWRPEKWKTLLGTLAHLGLNSLIFSVFFFFFSGKAGLVKGRFRCSFRLLRYGMAKTFNICVCVRGGGRRGKSESTRTRQDLL